jgi:phosphoglycerol transferase MdoB-like AlkP superfamily enzyme
MQRRLPPSLRLLLAGALGFLAITQSARGLLLALTTPRWTTAELPELLLTGLRVDGVSLGLLLSAPVLLWPLALAPCTAALWWRGARLWLGTLLLATGVLEALTPAYLAQYEARPHHLAVEYLRDWDSLLPMLWSGFRGPLLGGGVLLIAGLALALAWVARPIPRPVADRPWRLLALWPLLVLGCVLLARGSLDHRPANPAYFARWDDALLNHLALNSAYSFGHAAYARRHDGSAAGLYAAFDAWRSLDAEPPPTAPDGGAGPAAANRPLNLLIVVEESLGAEFSGRLGGLGWTPNLDRWAQHGLWFEALYATGTRSARGLEAIVAGFPPSPAPAILKRPGSENGIDTLASLLGQAGHVSRFIYGGGAHFDNMRGFFLGNGFAQVIENRDYPAPRHRGSWGVSDEDLFDRILAESQAAHERGERFFHLAFSSSHHEPFDIPAGRLPPEHDHPGTQEAAVRYADFALGRFLDAAAQTDWWPHTLVLVVADHDVRVYGEEVIPLRRFQIPGLLLGPDIPARPVTSLASQIDLAPTLLGRLGLPGAERFVGRDLFATLPELGGSGVPAPRALMQFDQRFGWLSAGELKVLHPGGRAERWRLDPKGRLHPAEPLTEAETLALKREALRGDHRFRRAQMAGRNRPLASADEERFMNPTPGGEPATRRLIPVTEETVP